MENKVKVIGITGGVGSGKSTITEILKDKYLAYLLNTDQIAHKLMQKGEISYNLIVEYFGTEILDDKGDIYRPTLGAIVYNNPDKLTKLNSFTHPYVMGYVKDIINAKRNDSCNLICIETALPAEAGLKDICDEIWYIYAPENIRRERLMRSRDYTNEKIDTIFQNQMKENEYKNICNYQINTDKDMENIIKQIEFLVEK